MSACGLRKRNEVRVIRIGILAVLVLSAWAGVLSRGMNRPWAAVCSMAGGVLAMTAGMVFAGLKHKAGMEVLLSAAASALTAFSGEKVELEAETDALRRDMEKQKREFGILAVAMVKTVADRVAAKIIARHTKNLPSPEHIESAMREASEIVANEIVSYGDSLRKKD